MDPRDRVFGPIATLDDSDDVTVDFGDFVRKIVLSDQVILDSIRLKELPYLVRKFGYDGVSELLKSQRFRIHWDAVTVGQTGQTALDSRVRKGLLPLGSYCFGIVKLTDRSTYIHEGLRAIEDVPGLRGKQGQKLRKLVAESLLPPNAHTGEKTLAQLTRDLETNSPMLKLAVALAVHRHVNKPLSVEDFALRVERIDEQDWRTETDLGERLGLDAMTTHETIGYGLLGAGGLNQRIEYMETFQALTGLQHDDLPLMEEKLSFLARQINPAIQSERFERVVTLVGLPDVDPNPEVQDVDLCRLLEVVADDEVHAFRRWLRGVDNLDDAAVEAEIHRIRDLMSCAVRSGPGKAVRFLATYGIGAFEPITGTALAALDTFLTEKVVPEPGPTAFLSRLYPSIFR